MKPHPTNASARRPFTLLELVFVLGIIGILLAVTLPAFLKLTRSNAVDTAASMIAAQLRLARAEAVARRQYIAVIMPGLEFINSDDTAIYRYQSFRAAIVERFDDDDFEFREWIDGTKWTFLPIGAVIPEVDEDAYTEADPSEDDPLPLPSDEITKELLKITLNESVEYVIPVDEEGYSLWVIRDENLSVVVDDLYPEDDEPSPNIEPGRCLFPGFSAECPKEQYLSAVSGTSVRAVIFAPNGRCVQRTYVTFMEGVNVQPDPIPVPREEGDDEEAVAGTPEDEYADEDEYEDEFIFQGVNKHNIRVLEVSPTTGKIRFLN